MIRVAQKAIKAGLVKNRGGKKRAFFPPPWPLLPALSFEDRFLKIFLVKLLQIPRSEKFFFWSWSTSLDFTSAWKMKCLKTVIFLYPFWPRSLMGEIVQKFFWEIFQYYFLEKWNFSWKEVDQLQKSRFSKFFLKNFGFFSKISLKFFFTPFGRRK